MLESYSTVFDAGEDEIVEKKSRFIAHVAPAETEEEAFAFVEKMRKKYWDARHHCFAFRIGTDRVLDRCSDDGEPSGTAGKPMLEVLTGKNLYNVVAVVIRYFGGTLLGTGGLVRAYTKSIQAGIEAATIIEKKSACILHVNCDYSFYGKLQYMTENMGIHMADSAFTDSVSIQLLVPVADKEMVKKKLTEASGGTALLEEGDQVFYGVVDKEILIFEQ